MHLIIQELWQKYPLSLAFFLVAFSIAMIKYRDEGNF